MPDYDDEDQQQRIDPASVTQSGDRIDEASSETQEPRESGEPSETMQSGIDTYMKMSQSDGNTVDGVNTPKNDSYTTVTENAEGRASEHSVTTQSGPDSFTTVTEQE